MRRRNDAHANCSKLVNCLALEIHKQNRPICCLAFLSRLLPHLLISGQTLGRILAISLSPFSHNHVILLRLLARNPLRRDVVLLPEPDLAHQQEDFQGCQVAR